VEEGISKSEVVSIVKEGAMVGCCDWVVDLVIECLIGRVVLCRE
jgi:hypothetical protein